MIFGSDLFGHFKPDPETYLGVAKLLDLEPGQVMMAAAHNNDLANARKCGLMTGFFARPDEYGPHQKRDYRRRSGMGRGGEGHRGSGGEAWVLTAAGCLLRCHS